MSDSVKMYGIHVVSSFVWQNWRCWQEIWTLPISFYFRPIYYPIFVLTDNKVHAIHNYLKLNLQSNFRWFYAKKVYSQE